MLVKCSNRDTAAVAVGRRTGALFLGNFRSTVLCDDCLSTNVPSKSVYIIWTQHPFATPLPRLFSLAFFLRSQQSFPTSPPRLFSLDVFFVNLSTHFLNTFASVFYLPLERGAKPHRVQHGLRRPQHQLQDARRVRWPLPTAGFRCNYPRVCFVGHTL